MAQRTTSVPSASDTATDPSSGNVGHGSSQCILVIGNLESELKARISSLIAQREAALPVGLVLEPAHFL